MDANKDLNRRWILLRETSRESICRWKAPEDKLRINPDGKRKQRSAAAGSENAGNDLINIVRAIKRLVLPTFPALAAITALTAFVTGCGSSSGSSGAANSGAGKPAYAPVQNERFVVSTVELSAILLDNQKYARWTFGIKLKQPVQLRSIRVEDVTEGSPVLLVNDQAPQVEGGAWTGYTGAIEPSASALPWLFDNTPARRTFRFTVTDLNGQESVLEQTVTYPVKTKKDLIKWYGFSA
jgi:hypothetical protein